MAGQTKTSCNPPTYSINMISTTAVIPAYFTIDQF